MPRTLDATSKAALGANLRDARKKRGWSQGKAAEHAGVLRTRLNRWEMGRETPGAEGLLLMAIAYECPVDDLLGGVDEAYDHIIERRIPVDAQHFYRARLSQLKALTLAAMDLTAAATGEPAPTPASPVASRATSRGTSKSTRVRRAPKKR